MDTSSSQLHATMYDACVTLVTYTPDKAYVELLSPINPLSYRALKPLYSLFRFSEEVKPSEKYAFYKKAAYHEAKQYIQRLFYLSQSITVLPYNKESAENIHAHARYVKMIFTEITERPPTVTYLSTLIGMYTILMTYWESVTPENRIPKIQRLFDTSLFYGDDEHRFQAHRDVVNMDRYIYSHYADIGENYPFHYLDLFITLAEFYRFHGDGDLDDLFLLGLDYVTFCLSEARIQTVKDPLKDPNREALARLIEVIHGDVISGAVNVPEEEVIFSMTSAQKTSALIEKLENLFEISIGDIGIKPRALFALIYQTAQTMDTATASLLFSVVSDWSLNMNTTESIETFLLFRAQTVSSIYHHFPRKPPS